MSVSSESTARPFLFGRIGYFLLATAISDLLYIYKTLKFAKSYKKNARSVKNFVIFTFDFFSFFGYLIWLNTTL